ncbi:ornithine decarboxylase antizyme AZ [Hydra vulgaris]|uniref:Ornithine decarboxylase antizyme n=1 Tax=Hydra vulgaris TaxID=6087 RepID=A0A8B6X0M4_HYDVU|nr:ornithine decarboxylase antizyme AZ [Hydra vulgaris]
MSYKGGNKHACIGWWCSNIIQSEIIDNLEGTKENFFKEALLPNECDQDGIELIHFLFEFKDGNHFISSWNGLKISSILFVEISKGELLSGNKESFVQLLDYSEEVIGASTLILCIHKDRKDREDVLRTFMFLGFQLVHHSNIPISIKENFLYMMYSFDD